MAIKNQRLIYGPNQPTEGVTVCFIDVDGIPIELLQFHKPEEEVCPNENKITGSLNNNLEVNYEFHHFAIYNVKNNRMRVINNYHDLHFNEKLNDNPFMVKPFYYYCTPNALKEFSELSLIAFKVDDIEKAIKSHRVIIDPFSPRKGFTTAVVEENGALIELFQNRNIFFMILFLIL